MTTGENTAAEIQRRIAQREQVICFYEWLLGRGLSPNMIRQTQEQIDRRRAEVAELQARLEECNGAKDAITDQSVTNQITAT